MIDIPTFLLALSLVESGGDDLAIGKHGERSRFQITEAVWKQHTNVSFVKYAKNPGIARNVATRHVERLTPLIEKRRVEVDPVSLALAWRYGIKGMNRAKNTRPGQDYAIRVHNIYWSIMGNRKKP